MSDRAFVFEVTQIGVESTPGTGVAANKKLLATSIVPSVQTETTRFTPQGMKYETIVVNGKEWTIARLTGVGAYTDLVYPLSGLFGAATITTPAGGTTSRDWAWTPASAAADTPKTFTVEWGSSVRAAKFLYGLMRALSIEFTRAGVAVTGEMMGQYTQDGISLTGSPTDIENQPILPNQIDVWLDTTSAGLGTTKLLRVMRANYSISDKFNTFWAMNSAVPSFAAHIETAPQARIDLSVGADSNGLALLTAMRDGSTRFMRIKATGATIEAAIKYDLQIDAAVKVAGGGEFTNTDGLTTFPFSLDVVHDSGWGKSHFICMTNKLTAL